MAKCLVRVLHDGAAQMGQYETDYTAEEVQQMVDSILKADWDAVLMLPYVNDHGLKVQTYIRMDKVSSLVIIPVPAIAPAPSLVEVRH